MTTGENRDSDIFPGSGAFRTTQKRRAALLEWITALPDRDGMTAPEIAREAVACSADGAPSCLYGPGYGAVICFNDLQVLASGGHIVRMNGRPATWWADR